MTAHFNSLVRFWSYHPALLCGIAFLLGIQFGINSTSLLLIPLTILMTPYVSIGISTRDLKCLKPLFLNSLVFLSAWLYVSTHFAFPVIPDKGLQGRGLLKINQVSLQNSFFGERWLYRCTVHPFIADEPSASITQSFPCNLYIRGDQINRPLANCDYWVEGRLFKQAHGTVIFKVSSKTVWYPLPNSWSWAEQRYFWKRKVQEWISKKFVHETSAAFIAGLLTGEFDDSWMKEQFARFGLQHLLAISGFHFAIIAGFLNFILAIFISSSWRNILLLICLASYCFFLGPQASILRAWLMCSMSLCATLCRKQTTALNSLGVALLVVLAFDPLLSQQVAFQLSFGITAAILLFYRPAQTCLLTFFPKRKLNQALSMNHLNQYGYCLIAFLRESLALTLAVNILALPLTLYTFHQFSWMSLFYNLFFPLLASISLCFFLLGVAFAFVPFLPFLIHTLNDYYTFFLLQMTYQMPTQIDHYWVVESLNSHLLMGYVCALCMAGILGHERFAQKESIQFI